MSNLPILLHVEDTPEDALLLQEALREVGVQVRYITAENAIQAYSYLRLLGSAMPALVVIDLNLPLIKGQVVLRELKAVVAWSRTPMVVLSSSQDQEEIAQCIRLGALDCITKPAVYEAYLEIAQRFGRIIAGVGHHHPAGEPDAEHPPSGMQRDIERRRTSAG